MVPQVSIPISNPNEDSSAGNSDDEVKSYAFALGERVKSFNADPLHPATYLKCLANYLKTPFLRRQRRIQPYLGQQACLKSFVVRYTLYSRKEPSSQTFNEPKLFALSEPPSVDEIVFMTGRPSAEWLSTIGAKYRVDHQFFHQHLGTILSAPDRCYYIPSLPSRSLQVLRLRFPSVIFVGSPGRNLDVSELEEARGDCEKQLKRCFRSVQDNRASEAGSSVIRRQDIFDGSTMVIEQWMTGLLVDRGTHWTSKSLRKAQGIAIRYMLVLIWSDAGSEPDGMRIPVPSTKEFSSVTSESSFCPVFFENDLAQARYCVSADEQNISLSPKQPLALLHNRYGSTIDWSRPERMAPLEALEELFAFNAASISQYVNMLERTLDEATSRDQFPSYEHTKLETVLHYDYVKTASTRFEEQLEETISFLERPPPSWRQQDPQTGPTRQDEIASALKGDFSFLLNRIKAVIKTCEAGKATLMSNASIQEAKRAPVEAKLVTELTKATNRLTFIFLPISFVTSVFGMNFRQFGQGSLSIWLWAVITIPLLVVSVIIVERGRWLKNRLRGTWRKEQMSY